MPSVSSSVCVYFGVIEWQVLSADDEVVGCDSIWNAVCLFHLFMQKQFCLWWSKVAKIDSIWSLRKGESDIKSWISVNVFVVAFCCCCLWRGWSLFEKNRTIWNLNAISVPYLKIKRLNIADQISTFCFKKTKQKKQVGTWIWNVTSIIRIK